MDNQRVNARESDGRGREGDGSDRGSGGYSAILDRVLREDVAELAPEQRRGESVQPGHGKSRPQCRLWGWSCTPAHYGGTPWQVAPEAPAGYLWTWLLV